MPDFGSFRGFGEKLIQGQTPTQLGKIGSEAFGFVGLLDYYPDAAVAYSLRLLRGLYVGNSIRVRRSSDNAEQDIGFNGSNIDTSALTSFCGTGNGFVTTWYDQSGNANNAIQATAANQPQIVSSGVIITQNGKPSLLFDGTNDSFLSTTAIDPLFITVVNLPNTTTNYNAIMGADSSQAGTNLPAFNFRYSLPSRTANFDRYTIIGANSATSNRQESNNVVNLITGLRDNTNSSIYTNDAIRGTGTTASTNVSLGGTDSGKFRLGASYFARSVSDYLSGNLIEFVAYTSDQSANRTGINTNINTYYAIY